MTYCSKLKTGADTRYCW